jgi:hypothetical protein
MKGVVMVREEEVRYEERERCGGCQVASTRWSALGIRLVMRQDVIRDSPLILT